MQRREFLSGTGAVVAALSVAAGSRAALAASPVKPASAGPVVSYQPATAARLAPVRAQADRITGVYVCTRPFRAQGPRIESERLGRHTIVHNYGHGGSGWSLSWGSSTLAVRMAQATGAMRIGVIGCGALGLTSALLAQRAGLAVRIYAKELPPDVRSSRATGLWTPDSRICGESFAPALAARWEAMARISFATYQSLLGLPGQPIEWIDGYRLSDVPFDAPSQAVMGEPSYGRFSESIRDLLPQHQDLVAGEHPFPQAYVRRYTTLMFNITAYSRMLLADFRAAGGKIEIREFRDASEFERLPERTLINATGYGARTLVGDESILPVRGQTARLIPQPEVNYGLSTETFGMVPRSDGLLVQSYDDQGDFNNEDVTPDRAASERAVSQLADLFTRMRPG